MVDADTLSGVVAAFEAAITVPDCVYMVKIGSGVPLGVVAVACWFKVSKYRSQPPEVAAQPPEEVAQPPEVVAIALVVVVVAGTTMADAGAL